MTTYCPFTTFTKSWNLSYKNTLFQCYCTFTQIATPNIWRFKKITAMVCGWVCWVAIICCIFSFLDFLLYVVVWMSKVHHHAWKNVHFSHHYPFACILFCVCVTHMRISGRVLVKIQFLFVAKSRHQSEN